MKDEGRGTREDGRGTKEEGRWKREDGRGKMEAEKGKRSGRGVNMVENSPKPPLDQMAGGVSSSSDT